MQGVKSQRVGRIWRGGWRTLGAGCGGLGGEASGKQYGEDGFGEWRGRGGIKEQKGEGMGFGGEGRCLVPPRI